MRYELCQESEPHRSVQKVSGKKVVLMRYFMPISEYIKLSHTVIDTFENEENSNELINRAPLSNKLNNYES